MTHNLIEELEQIVELGTDLAADTEASVPQVRQWLQERQAAFERLGLVAVELTDDERRGIARVIAELMRLDGVILPALERRLDQLGQELAGARKMRRALGAAQAPRLSILERLI